MKLINIIDSIKIIDEEIIFVQSSDSTENKLLTEYLSNYDSKRISKEIEKLEKFEAIRKSDDKIKLRDYLTYELDAFIEYNFGTFAYIAGASDLTITVLYDTETDKVFLKHPYGPDNEKHFITAIDLITLLRKLQSILLLFIS